MDGSLVGNIIGIGYYGLFILMGMVGVFFCWRIERPLVRLYMGSVVGTVAMLWIPALSSLFLGFTIPSHLVGLFCALVLLLGTMICYGRKKDRLPLLSSQGWRLREHSYVLLVLPFYLFFLVLLDHQLFLSLEGGSVHTGQAGLQEVNIHLAFITRLADQGLFPAGFRMMFADRKAFFSLGDSVSASIYLFGSSLRAAFLVPVAVTMFQLMVGVLFLGRVLLRSRAKGVLAWCFFFFGGGLGFLYFLPGVTKKSYAFSEMLQQLFLTPTNLSWQNIQWNNMFVDVLLVKRDVLFGYTLLVPSVFFLYRAAVRKTKGDMLVAAVLSGALPMVHMHSALAMWMIGAMWMIYSLRTELDDGWKKKESRVELWVIFFFFLLMTGLDLFRREGVGAASFYFGMGIFLMVTAAALCVFLAVKCIKKNGRESIVIHYIWYFGIVCILVLPQVLFWRLGLGAEDGLVRGAFNWANQNDTYLVFYLKNMGIVWCLGLLALIFTKTRNYVIVAPAFFIWSVAELIVFQQETLDNQKLLDVAWLLWCMFAADYVLTILKKLGRKRVTAVVLSCILVLSSASALLSAGREAVSDYELFDEDEVKMCRYIEKHTSPSDVILTDTRYYNAVASLTGRNVLSASAEGEEWKDAIRDMYQHPENQELYQKYQVTYIFLGTSERKRYQITSENTFAEKYELVHVEGYISLYRRNDVE